MSNKLFAKRMLLDSVSTIAIYLILLLLTLRLLKSIATDVLKSELVKLYKNTSKNLQST
jgi:hypothetical protein